MIIIFSNIIYEISDKTDVIMSKEDYQTAEL